MSYHAPTVQVAETPHVVQFNRKDGIGKGLEVAGTLGAGDYRGLNRNQDQTAVLEGARIRRLTPTECERLQGFPDGWTQGSDTQRYKQCGNAVTVNVVEAVIRGMLPCLS
jgi:DNA (cytosine-5)-methyltransferase 1